MILGILVRIDFQITSTLSIRSTLKDLKAEFKRTDIEQDDHLSRDEFIGCLSRFGFKLRKEVARDLADSLTDHNRERERNRDGGRDDSGVDYGDFVAVLKAEIEAEEHVDGALEGLRQRMRKGSKREADIKEV